MYTFKTVIFIISLLFLLSCKKNEKATNISPYNETEAHNMGQNCMNCHKSGGDGEGIFQAAGTVYDSTLSVTLPNTTVYLYTEQGGNGTLKHTVEVDGLGNFYTT